MKVAIVVPRYPPAVGGVEWHAYKLANELKELGVGVEVICTDPGSRQPSQDMVNGVTIRRFPTLGGDSTFMVSPSLGVWLERHATEYDLIHAHSYHTPLPVIASLVSLRSGVPVVVTLHFHGTGHTWRRRILHIPYRVAAVWMLRRVSMIICVSNAERRLLRERFRLPATKIVVIPNGVDPQEFSKTPRVVQVGKRRTILVVGRLEAYKRASRCIRAAAFLPSDMDLVVVGDGAEREAMHAAAAEVGLGSRFKWFPSLAREELLAWYRKADVFVSMSVQEAFGITLLEAAVAGARVVASDIAPHREVAAFLPENAVSLVDPASSDEQLADAIVRAASEGPVTGAEKTVPTWRTMAQRTLATYSKVMAESQRLQ